MFLQIVEPDAILFAPILAFQLAKITFGYLNENALTPHSGSLSPDVIIEMKP
jgi:hypothetical protein